jgi:hypothetical protein
LPDLSALPERFTVTDIAANLVDALCASGMEGPYHLAGWSVAGVIAYEMARQLRSRGRDIALLALFDTNNPDYLRGFSGWRGFPIRAYFWLEKVIHYLRKTRGVPLRRAWRYFRDSMRKFTLKPTGDEPGREDRSTKKSEKPPAFSWKVQYRAAEGYRPEPCDWPVALFRSTVLQTGWFRDPRLGWGKVARGGLAVYEMPGEHDTMFIEPEVQRLASMLNDCLRKAHRGEALPAPEGAPVRIPGE